jgi:hypothetical protein
MSLCLRIPLFSTILFLKSPSKRWYIILEEVPTSQTFHGRDTLFAR